MLLEQGNTDACIQCDLEVKSEGILFSTTTAFIDIICRSQYWYAIN